MIIRTPGTFINSDNYKYFYLKRDSDSMNIEIYLVSQNHKYGEDDCFDIFPDEYLDGSEGYDLDTAILICKEIIGYHIEEGKKICHLSWIARQKNYKDYLK